MKHLLFSYGQVFVGLLAYNLLGDYIVGLLFMNILNKDIIEVTVNIFFNFLQPSQAVYL